jgi:sugar lactone lactonase YvrE
MGKRLWVSILLALAPLAGHAQQTISTLAGGGPNNLPALSANIAAPNSVAKDSSGNLFIAAAGANRVYKLDLTGEISIVAGTGVHGLHDVFGGDGGLAVDAELAYPSSVAVDAQGNVFIADYGNVRIREVVAATGIIQTVAGNGTPAFGGDGGPATAASLAGPGAVIIDGVGDLLILDAGKIRRVVAATGVIQTLVDLGYSGTSSFCTDASGNFYVTEYGIFLPENGGFLGVSEVVKVAAGTGIITHVAGTGSPGFDGDGGPATSAAVTNPLGVTADSQGNIFIADTGSNRIREVEAASGIIKTVAGNGVPFYGLDGELAINSGMNPAGVLLEGSGKLLVADTLNNRITEILLSTGIIHTLAGNGTVGFSGDGSAAVNASLQPGGLAVDGLGNLYIADSGNNRIREVLASTGKIQTIAGNENSGFTGDGGLAVSSPLQCPVDVTIAPGGNVLIADSCNYRIREVNAMTGVIQTVAGNGQPGYSGDGGLATSASIDYPTGIFVDPSADIFVSSTDGRIRKVSAINGIIQTVAGNGTLGFSGDGGAAVAAQLNLPNGLFVDKAGNLFIADTSNNRIREVLAATGIIQTVAGNGVQGFSGDGGSAIVATLNTPTGVAVDAAGNIFIADASNKRVREVMAGTGVIQTIAGNGDFVFAGDGGSPLQASLSFPYRLVLDPAGSLLVSVGEANRVRQISGVEGLAFSKPSLVYDPAQVLGTDQIRQDLTLTNTGSAILLIGGIVLSGSSDFSQSNTCGTSLAVGANCQVQVTLKASSAGPLHAALTITDTAPNSPQTILLSGAGIDFSLAPASGSSGSTTVTAGQTALFSIRLSAIGGFTSSDQLSVLITCSGAPQNASCSVPSQSVVAKPTSPATFAVSISTGTNSISLPTSSNRPSLWQLLAALLLISASLVLRLLAADRRKKMSWSSRIESFAYPLGFALSLLIAALFMLGCGSSSSRSMVLLTPPGTYQITITATAGTVSHSTQLTLTVQ